MKSRDALLAVIIFLVVRDARADCASGGSEGYDQCQKFPSCRCTYEVKTCPNGGWYWHYSVADPCPEARRPGSTTPVSPQPKSECEAMQRYLAWRHTYLGLYSDEDLVSLAEQLGWSSSYYHMMVWRLAHPLVVPQGGLAATASMYTDGNCEIQKYEEGCAKMKASGLPQAACEIAREHELVHVRLCKERGAPKSETVRTASNDERLAYQREIDLIDKWLKESCK